VQQVGRDRAVPDARSDSYLGCQRRPELFGWDEDEVYDSLVAVYLQGWPVLVHWKAEAAFLQVAQTIENMDYRIEELIHGPPYRRHEPEFTVMMCYAARGK
jgi:hypothetical protein